MKKTLFIFCYSYQKKNLEKIFAMADLFSSKYNVSLSIVDQSSNKKDNKVVSKKFSLNYVHVQWDSISSPIEYKKYFLIISKFDYYMHIGNDVDISLENLDKMIDFLEKNNNCLITQNKDATTDFVRSSLINRNFILASRASAIKINFPTFAKYNGEQEYIFYHAIKDGLTVYEVSSKMVYDNTVDLNSLDYVPFYLSHNYNKIAEEVGLKKNTYEYNDVSYNIRKSKFDNILGERYINKTNVID
jgi:hypothetical protein